MPWRITFALVPLLVYPACRSGDAPPREPPATVDVGAGFLEIRLFPVHPALALKSTVTLIDPHGQEASSDGVAQIEGVLFEEESIDDDETGARGPTTLIVYVEHPRDGDYEVSVAAREQDSYVMQVRAADRAGDVTDHTGSPVHLDGGSRHRYRITYAAAPGSAVRVLAEHRP